MVRLLRRAFLAVLAVGALCGTIAPILACQSVINVPSTPLCPDCRIALTRIASIGDTGGPGSLSGFSRVERDSRGRFYAVDVADWSHLIVYNPNGAFRQTIGRRGAGPGEYKVIQDFHVTRGDTIRLFDPANARETILAPTYAVARSRQLPGIALNQGAYAWFPDGSQVVSGLLPTSNAFGLPYHRLDPHAAKVYSFGDSGRPLTLRTAYGAVRRPLTAASDGRGFWGTTETRERFQLWSTAGRLQREIDIDIPGIGLGAPDTVSGALDPKHPPPARIRALRQRGNGYLWVLVLIGDPEWRHNLVEKIGADGPYYEPKTYSGVYDTMIEVIDPKRARLVAMKRVDDLIFDFADVDHVVGARTDADGRWYFDIYSIGLDAR